jgi:hypothetical protein
MFIVSPLLRIIKTPANFLANCNQRSGCFGFFFAQFRKVVVDFFKRISAITQIIQRVLKPTIAHVAHIFPFGGFGPFFGVGAFLALYCVNPTILKSALSDAHKSRSALLMQAGVPNVLGTSLRYTQSD